MPWDDGFATLVGEHENYLDDLFENRNSQNASKTENEEEENQSSENSNS